MTGSAGRSGILLVDKPAGITSHDVVARVRGFASTRKVGHAGTLDPMATGLLVVGINSSTRLLTFLVGLDKGYDATIRLGRSTTTDDADGEFTGPLAETRGIGGVELHDGMAALTGPISQVPSAVSAIKVAGRRSYELVRAGEAVELAPRTVTVAKFDLVAIRPGEFGLDLDVRVECSSGTYIRALARDLGAALGVGGHLVALRRTRIGPFDVDDAGKLHESLLASLLTPAEVAGRLFETVSLSDGEVLALAQGKRVVLAAVGPGSASTPVAAVAPDGRLAGLVSVADGVARVIVNFPADEVLA